MLCFLCCYYLHFIHYSELLRASQVLITMIGFSLAPNSNPSGADLFNLILHCKAMSRVCQFSGIRPQSGNNVSHANNKTRRRFLPNLHWHRLWSPQENRYVRLRLSNRALRTIDKIGVDAALQKMRAEGVRC